MADVPDDLRRFARGEADPAGFPHREHVQWLMKCCAGTLLRKPCCISRTLSARWQPAREKQRRFTRRSPLRSFRLSPKGWKPSRAAISPFSRRSTTTCSTKQRSPDGIGPNGSRCPRHDVFFCCPSRRLDRYKSALASCRYLFSGERVDAIDPRPAPATIERERMRR